MKTILFKIEKFAREKRNEFITAILIIAAIGFYLGFVFGRCYY
ncbi:hypothetical protein [Flavobacterium panici]|uniref:Uncharacterized protein n=1 Tax=Flavobacterium panici TaxID=2654843 RepID=A0A9N8J005_9FLAO|nr:hypothetical protein [Flavobacterium panici]CAC9973719.1 hypothetical protein FLAPXU55_01407 [Flavobacterium panici]